VAIVSALARDDRQRAVGGLRPHRRAPMGAVDPCKYGNRRGGEVLGAGGRPCRKLAVARRDRIRDAISRAARSIRRRRFAGFFNGGAGLDGASQRTCEQEWAMSDNHDDALLRQFEDCSLPLDRFHHRVHIQIAFLYLHKYSVLDVLRRFPEALKRYVAAHGKVGMYHETITWTYILLIHERMQRAGRPQAWTEFASGNPDLLTWTDTILKRYYRDETLSSDLARKMFVLPDKASALP
jgi:hypothetical protein